MSDLSDMISSTPRIAVIVIGRNEGQRLRLALESLPHAAQAALLYVDSGSTDGSVELARASGVDVLSLDPARPFSAARARHEGVQRLLALYPAIEFIQFLDGDCTLEPGWIDTAVEQFRAQRDVGVVCGMLSEAAPDASPYNRMSHLQWQVAAGEIQACGGIFMVRRAAYEAAGGFNCQLLTREERDLCARIRAAGNRIIRIDAAMAQHDAALLRFSQWWVRAVWGGYGDALHISTQTGRLKAEHWHRIWRYLTWPLAIPLLLIIGTITAFWWPRLAIIPLLCLASYAVLVLRVAASRLAAGDTISQAMMFAALRLVRKFATGFGFVMYFVQRLISGRRPDPHAAGAGAGMPGSEPPVPSRSLDQLPMVER